ncbi:MAG: DNA polymerase, partial [Nitrosopumilus sp.]|nr:DNA polymerase [Nitrosopumilus sp.]
MAEPVPVTDYKDLAKLRTDRPQNRNFACSKLREIHAIDTETWRGDIFLIADSDGRFLDDITPDSAIQFLFSKKYQNTWNFFYNLSYDAEVILKLLDQELFRYNLTRKLEFYHHDYKIEYIPSKLLRIKKGHHSVLFYDIAQFYNKSLADAYLENIGKLPDSYLKLKGKRSEFSPWFYSHNKKKIRNYCIADCMLTKELVKHWITLFYDAFSFYPAKWPSSGYLAEKVLINNGILFPRFDSIPYEIQDLAFRSYFGGRFEMMKRGFIGQAYLYDINSAYPFAISQLPDIDDGKWIKRKSVHEKAGLGFFRILADIPDDETIPPFAFRANQNIVFPSGKFITYCTLQELQACRVSDFYRILEGYQFVPNSDMRPYGEFIENLYEKRLELKQQNNPLQQPLKIILNSIYGKTGQKVNRVIGNLFNPAIFASITGHTRAQLYRFITENNLEKNTVAFATDSVCVTKRLGIDSKRLGEFSFDGEA